METIKEILANPYFQTLAEFGLKGFLCILGILLYRRLGKKTDAVFNKETSDKITFDDLESFACSLTATVDKIHELKDKSEKK